MIKGSGRSEAEPLRVLFLATYFPRPGSPTTGTWALEQALALRRQPIDLRVVSFTSWVPAPLARTPGARAFSRCPPAFRWGTLDVEYPRWLAYPMPPMSRLTYRFPDLQAAPGWWSARPFLRRLVSNWRPHVLYAHHSLTNGSLAWHCRREMGLPYLVTDHDLGEIEDCGRYRARWRAMGRVAEGAFRSLSVSRRMEQVMLRQFPFARTRTLHNGTNAIPPEIASAPRPRDRRSQVVVFSAGMFYERKGFPLLIEAFADATRGRSDAHLRIAGDGPARAAIEAAIRRLGLQERVHLLGLLPHRDVLQEMVWADAFALVGWDEPFGVVFAEALAAGCPTIMASDSGAAEVVQHGVHCLLVSPRDVRAAADALRSVLQDRALAKRLGAAGRALWSSRLTWDVNATALVSLFREAAEEEGRHA
jgi:glycosyltransferase involved in cell wall biosynthesis